MSRLPIQHIADTARWIAAFRALESEREDAVFKDYLARIRGAYEKTGCRKR